MTIIKRRFPCFVVYKDKAGGFRWRFHARNGLIVAVASESYARKPACLRGIALLKASAAVPVVEDESVVAKARGTKAPKKGAAAAPKPTRPAKAAPKPTRPAKAAPKRTPNPKAPAPA